MGKRWTVSVNLQGKLYLVPGGNIGRKYVDLLTKEVRRLNQNECVQPINRTAGPNEKNHT